MSADDVQIVDFVVASDCDSKLLLPAVLLKLLYALLGIFNLSPEDTPLPLSLSLSTLYGRSLKCASIGAALPIYAGDSPSILLVLDLPNALAFVRI